MRASPFFTRPIMAEDTAAMPDENIKRAHDLVRRFVRRGPQQIQPLQHGDLLGGLVLVGVVEARVGVARHLASEHVRPAVHVPQAEGGSLVNGHHMGVVCVFALADVGHECAYSLFGVVRFHILQPFFVVFHCKLRTNV